MAQTIAVGGHPAGTAATVRSDRWWVGPLLTVLGLGGFVIYTTWAAFQGNHYYHGSYLSPLYSPVFFVEPSAAGAAPLAHSWFGTWPGWWPAFLPVSPAFFILVFPGSFRATCYYYRKAYYRSLFGSPPGCSVNPVPRGTYRGETFLLLFQNLHRYALYAAIVFIFILSYDAMMAFFRDGRFGVGVGSLVMTLNAVLLGAYTFGCHSFRHLVGGRLDCFSCDGSVGPRYGIWKRVSWLNARHMQFAWLSLIWVGFTDFYIRMVSLGIIRDLNTWG
ncbi:MAG: succinate dehydrogenase [Acidobacteria bacterium]|nr:succinate dehydrogenase [Acidobacteriota bacterium]